MPSISGAVFESVAHRQNLGVWFVPLVLLMPDHLHALVEPASNQRLKSLIDGWKGFLAKKHGLVWQRDFFEHRIRNGEEKAKKAGYIRANPVRAGLVEKAGDWPYVWAASFRG